MLRTLRRWLRNPRLLPLYPARFRTERPQPRSELAEWFRDQTDPESRAFDARYGVSTRWFDLDNYEPTPPSVVREILDRLDPAGRRFVDLGSGKGRALLIAAERPFVEVIGVEHKRLLHWRASRNVAACRVPLAAPVRLVRADAADFRPPPGPTVLFLYNPFPEPVLRAAMRQATDPDTLLAYVNPIHHGAVLAEGWEELHRVDAPGQDRCWRLYARDPEATRAARAARRAPPG